MYMGEEDGNSAVPEPMALIDIRFLSFPPTRMPMSSPFITSNVPMSIFMPPMFMPGIWPMGLAPGLADGIGIFIFPGDGEAAGMFIPGMSACMCGEGAGVGDGDIPGIF